MNHNASVNHNADVSELAFLTVVGDRSNLGILEIHRRMARLYPNLRLLDTRMIAERCEKRGWVRKYVLYGRNHYELLSGGLNLYYTRCQQIDWSKIVGVSK